VRISRRFTDSIISGEEYDNINVARRNFAQIGKLVN
jgi:hypothetical protein